MIKLINILNELSINNPAITPERVLKLIDTHITTTTLPYIFHKNHIKSGEYIDICQPYCKKYNIAHYIANEDDVKKLSQSDLNKLYKELIQLIKNE